jgi:hypothetical protein
VALQQGKSLQIVSILAILREREEPAAIYHSFCF